MKWLWTVGQLAMIASSLAEKPPRRISAEVVDLGKVQTVHMVAGMATLIEIPGPITGIRAGNPDSIQYFKPDKPDNEVTVVLKSKQAQATNLILRSGKAKYVFDIIPSKDTHQDTVEIVGSFGGASLSNRGAEMIDSSDNSPTIAKAK